MGEREQELVSGRGEAGVMVVGDGSQFGFGHLVLAIP